MIVSLDVGQTAVVIAGNYGKGERRERKGTQRPQRKPGSNLVLFAASAVPCALCVFSSLLDFS
jgi:hypothetical protein